MSLTLIRMLQLWLECLGFKVRCCSIILKLLQFLDRESGAGSNTEVALLIDVADASMEAVLESLAVPGFLCSQLNLDLSRNLGCLRGH